MRCADWRKRACYVAPTQLCHSARSRGIHAAVDRDALRGLQRLRFAPRRMTGHENLFRTAVRLRGNDEVSFLS